MGFLVLFLLIAFPAAEIVTLMRVSQVFGFWNTLFLLIFSAVFGVQLAKHQGMVSIVKIQECMAQGRVPAREMLDGILIFIGGILFVIPGFISDAIGLILVLPPTRWLVKLVLTGTGKTSQRSESSESKPVYRKAPDREFPVMEKGRGMVQDADIVRETKKP